MAELKPCPFCGSPKIAIYPYQGYTVKVCCFNCSAQIYRGTEQEAIEAWNRRAEDENKI